jgi:outer membrane protein TolC
MEGVMDAPETAGLPDLTRSMELSLEQAQRIALDNNLDLENARRDLRLAKLDIVRSRAGYDPYLQADASYSNSSKPSSQAIFGQTSETSSVTLSSGISTITGGSLSLDFRNSRSESDSVFSTLNPSYNTDLSMNFRQPILKNRFNDTRAMELLQKQNDYERTLMTLESKVLELQSQVEDAYWSLVRARLDLRLKRRSIELTERMDRITRTQVGAGVAAPVSTLQTEANLASARASLIRSENEYRKSQASLKMVLNLADQDLWSLELVPTDLPRYEPTEFDRDELVNEAMASNFSLRQLRLSISNSEVNNDQAKNRTLPQLDFRASVGVSGLAGTDNPQDQIIETGFVVPNPLPPDQFPQPYIVERAVIPGQPSEFEGDYIDSFNNMMEGDNLSWSAGLTFNLPIGNRAARSDLERTMISYEKMLSDWNDQQRQVFMNLVNLVYDLEASHRNLLAAREASRLQGQNLEIEEKKYSLGMNTSYEVMQAEESFAESRSGEIGALIEYNKMVGRMDRARKGYLTAGGPALTSLPISLPSGISMGGGLPAGIDQSMIQQYAGMLPAGIDINALRSFMP